MASAAAIAYSTILKKGDGGLPESFTDYGLEINSVGGLGMSRAAIGATHMQSANGYEEFIFGLKTNKPFTVEINWLPSMTGAIQAILEGAQGNWQVLFADNSNVTFTAGINDFAVGSLTPDGKMTATLSFTPSGKPTWA
jgi:hypothetical protein